MLRFRLATAIFLGSCTIWSIFYLPTLFNSVLVSLIACLASDEYAKILNWSGLKRSFFTGSILVSSLAMMVLWHEKMRLINIAYIISLWIISVSSLWWILSVPRSLLCYERGQKWSWHSELAGWLVFSSFCISMHILLCYYQSAGMIVFLLLVVWSSDIGAYLFGRLLGRHKLASKISPNKTIEGALAGMISACFGGWLAFVILLNDRFIAKLTLNQVELIALIIGAFSIIGDLFESMLKRKAKVKDSGNLLPGHGGVYDRIDSLVASAPIYVLIFTFIIKIIE